MCVPFKFQSPLSGLHYISNYINFGLSHSHSIFLFPFFKLIATNHHRPSPIATVTPPLHFPTTISQLRV
ncbi:hypothetical protein L2E82_28265 [Cichorium intybus]|uniref:Uncharacterized protein n=1 Tax=Cichorium intybus TaxID=13427 RepID=A0ACB9CVC2_CICIN|nr:hypothetical protein L2E82_28265 [Cichorium intybus]